MRTSDPTPLEKERLEDERLKREFLQIEDLTIGRGPLAAFGRKLRARVVIRYAGDGTLAYQGPVLTYWGIDGSPFIHNSLRAPGLLSLVSQSGIHLGINGMAVGGTRRFTIAPMLVCGWTGLNEADPSSTCLLATGKKANTSVRKEALIVEATLTEACAPPSPWWEAGMRAPVETWTSPNESSAIPSGASTTPSHCDRETASNGIGTCIGQPSLPRDSAGVRSPPSFPRPRLGERESECHPHEIPKS